MANLSDFGFSIPDAPEEKPDVPVATSMPESAIAPGKNLSEMGFSLSDQPQTKPSPEEAPTIPWSEIPQSALEHAPESATEFASNIVQPFIHPIETATSLKNLGQGVMEHLGILSGTEHTKYADAVGEYLKTRYGSIENIKRSMATDPVGMAADISMVLTGGGTAVGRLPGLVGKTGEIVGAAGRIIDPITAASKPISAVGRKIIPKAEGASELAAKGVLMTPGQMIGSWPKALEDAVTSIPILGSYISSGRAHSIESFNKAVANQALEPIGESLSKGVSVGHDVVSEVADKLGKAYDNLVPKLKFMPDKQFAQDMIDIRNKDVSKLPSAQIKQFENIFATRVPRAGISGEMLKSVESELTEFAANYRSSSDAAQRDLGRAINNVNMAIRSNLERTNPAHAAELAQINSGWAMYTRLRDAAVTGNKEGIFSPNDLLRAVRKGDRSRGKGSFAKGDALMQTFAEAGQRILPSKLPSSGTAERAAAMAGIGGLSYLLSRPEIIAGGALAALPYTRPGMGLVNKAVYGTLPPNLAKYLPSRRAITTPAFQAGRLNEIESNFAHGGRVWHKKLDHKSVGYVARSRRQEHCAACSMFIAKGGPACTLVKSPINPAGWCRRFVKKKLSMADGGNVGDASEWENLPHTPEGIPQITVPPPQNPMMTQGMGDIVRGVGSALVSPITDAYKLATGKVMPEEVPWTTAMALGSLIGPPGEAQAVGAAERVAPKFYSALEQAVGKIPQARMPAEQWMGTLANKPGVRPDELAWTGLQDFLTTKKGQPVSKQEMLDYLANNKITVQEVTKAEKRTSETGRTIFQDRDELAVQQYNTPYDKLASEQKRWVDDELASRLPTKFGQWQLAGGTNYREKLLTLPYEKRGLEIREGETAVDALNRAHAEYPVFKPPHWDEPNVLAHYRMNDRMVEAPGDSAPKESLHLEELQSDWHQKGRKEGYDDPSRYQNAKKEYDDYISGLRNRAKTFFMDAAETDDERETARRMGEKLSARDDVQSLARAMDEQDKEWQLRNAIAEARGIRGVPDAPFKKNWHELALKSAVRDAIESGKDRVSWTPGEAQAERYDLSKRVSKVEFVGDRYLSAWDKNGEKIMSREVTPQELPDYIGKDAAEKLLAQKPKDIQKLPNVNREDLSLNQTEHQYIVTNKDGREVKIGKGTVASEDEALDYAVRYLNKLAKEINQNRDLAGARIGPTRTLAGLDLKVGGEGMKGFYDQILPKAVEKIFKEYGVKVKKGSVPGHYKSLRDLKPESLPVWYFDIPQALKNASLQKGHPLFAKGGRVRPKTEMRPLRIPRSLSAIQAALKATRKT